MLQVPVIALATFSLGYPDIEVLKMTLQPNKAFPLQEIRG